MRYVRCFRCEPGADGGCGSASFALGLGFAREQKRLLSFAFAVWRRFAFVVRRAAVGRLFCFVFAFGRVRLGGGDTAGGKGFVGGTSHLLGRRGLYRAGGAFGGGKAGAVRQNRDPASCLAHASRPGNRRALSFVLLVGLVIFLLFPLLFVPTFGEEQTEEKEGEEVVSFLSSLKEILPDAARPYLPEDPADTDSLRQAVGFRRILSLAVNALQNGFSEARFGLVRLLGVTLLFSAAAAFGKGRLTSLVMEVGGALSLFSLLSGSGVRVTAFFSDLSDFSVLLSPLYTLALAGGGAVTGAASAAGAFTGFVTVLDVVATGLLGPLLQVLLALVLLSALGNGGAVGELSARLSGVYIFLLSLLGVLLTAALAFEGSLASSADSVATRTVKFALGNALPLVGGTVSALLGSLQASLSLIKSAMGATSLIVLLSLCLPLLWELFLWRTALSLCDGLAVLLGAPSFGSVLVRFRRIYDLMLAGTAIVSVLFLFTVGLLSRGMGVA